MIMTDILVCSSFLISVCIFIVSVGSICLVCCVYDRVCELFGETISNMLGVVVSLCCLR